jgi:hypothetical protein
MLFTVVYTVDEGRRTTCTNVNASSKDEVKEILDNEEFPKEVTIRSIKRTVKHPNPDYVMED